MNALKSRLQRSRYDEIERKHYWQNTIMGVAAGAAGGGGGVGGNSAANHQGGEGGGGGGIDDGSDRDGSAMHQVARGEDPLSSLLHNETTANNNNEGKNKFFGGKGKEVFGDNRWRQRSQWTGCILSRQND